MIKVQDSIRGTVEVTKVFPGDVIAEEHTTHFNGLTPAEAERLAVLIEEASEVQQIACKILRNGYQSFNPDLIVNQRQGGPKLTNRAMLEKEIGHLQSAVRRMYAADDIDRYEVLLHQRRKADTGGQYMHHQPDTPQEKVDG